MPLLPPWVWLVGGVRPQATPAELLPSGGVARWGVSPGPLALGLPRQGPGGGEVGFGSNQNREKVNRGMLSLAFTCSPACLAPCVMVA